MFPWRSGIYLQIYLSIPSTFVRYRPLSRVGLKDLRSPSLLYDALIAHVTYILILIANEKHILIQYGHYHPTVQSTNHLIALHKFHNLQKR